MSKFVRHGSNYTVERSGGCRYPGNRRSDSSEENQRNRCAGRRPRLLRGAADAPALQLGFGQGDGLGEGEAAPPGRMSVWPI